jgi:hypothetical protein
MPSNYSVNPTAGRRCSLTAARQAGGGAPRPQRFVGRPAAGYAERWTDKRIWV